MSSSAMPSTYGSQQQQATSRMAGGMNTGAPQQPNNFQPGLYAKMLS